MVWEALKYDTDSYKLVLKSYYHTGPVMRKNRFPIESPGTSEKVLDLESGWVIFTAHVEKRVAPKLLIIILVQLGLVAFDFHFPKIRKVIIFIIVGPSGHALKTNYFQFWTHQITQNVGRKMHLFSSSLCLISYC